MALGTTTHGMAMIDGRNASSCPDSLSLSLLLSPPSLSLFTLFCFCTSDVFLTVWVGCLRYTPAFESLRLPYLSFWIGGRERRLDEAHEAGIYSSSHPSSVFHHPHEPPTKPTKTKTISAISARPHRVDDRLSHNPGGLRAKIVYYSTDPLRIHR